MKSVGIRALQQNAAAAVAEARAGAVIEITDRGRPVAMLGPLPSSRLDALVAAGIVEVPTRSLTDLPGPEPGADLSAAVAAQRAEDLW